MDLAGTMSILKHVLFLRPFTFLHNVQITTRTFHTSLLATPTFTAIHLSMTQHSFPSRASPFRDFTITLRHITSICGDLPLYRLTI